jgi:hypothetical protein
MEERFRLTEQAVLARSAERAHPNAWGVYTEQ